MCKKLSLLLLCLIPCSSCTQSRVDRSVAIQAQESVPSLSMVQQTETVEIENDWNGYSDITPILRHYKLRVQNQELVGNAHIAVGGYGAAGIRQQVTRKIKIPAGVTAKFFATLAKTPISKGSYKPIINHPDDYPAVVIQVKAKSQKTIFSSQSQAQGNMPWKVTLWQEPGTVTGAQQQASTQKIASKLPQTKTDYISNSALPSQALKLLSPYLDNQGVEGIIQRRRQKNSHPVDASKKTKS